MSLGMWLLGGTIGGLLGAGLWSVLGYFTGFELRWIACLVGALTGVGVRIIAGDAIGPAPGIVAALVAGATILLGKYLVLYLLVARVAAELDLSDMVEPVHFVSEFAGNIATERAVQGEPIEWPGGVEPQVPSEQEQFPPEIWQEATALWDALGRDRQRKLMNDRVELMYEGIAGEYAIARNRAFMAGFRGYAILWLLLALATAYKIGSGFSGHG